MKMPSATDKRGQWVRQYNGLQNARSFVLSSFVALVCLPLVWMSVQQPAPLSLPRPRPLYQSFSIEHTPGELQAMLGDAHQLVYANYIRRDLALKNIHDNYFGYQGRLGTEGDLAQALNNLTTGLSDPWSQALTTEAAVDERLRLSGQKIGVEMDFAYDSTRKGWKVTRSFGTAEAAGLRADDEIVTIDGDDPAQYESNQSDDVKQLLLGFPPDNLFGTGVVLAVRHKGGELLECEIPRVVVGAEPALKSSNGQDSSVQVVTVQFFRSPTLVDELQAVLTAARDKPLRGVVLNLSQVEGGSAETTARAAALFMKEGLVCRSVVNVSDTPEAYWLESWFVTASGVKLVRSGPFLPEGKQEGPPQPSAADVVIKEVKMKTGLFDGPVAFVTDWGTRGAPELFVSAVRSAKPDRVIVFGSTSTWGKGLGQKTYDSIAGPYALRFSTHYNLTSTGVQLERRAVLPNEGAVIDRGDDVQAAAVSWMLKRAETIPAPILPVQK